MPWHTECFCESVRGAVTAPRLERLIPCGPGCSWCHAHPAATVGCLTSCPTRGWLVCVVAGDSGACPHAAGKERRAIACCGSHGHSTLIPLVPFVLQREPVLLLLAMLGRSLLVACWGTSGQVTQIWCVRRWKETGASGWPEMCVSVPQQLLYMSMTADFLAQLCHFHLRSGRGLFS